MVIGNQFPIGVFGVLMLLLLGVNPLLGRLGKRWPLRPGELALITALGLAVCGWPGSGFFRYFTTDMSLPSKMINSNPAWQAAHVMSYVPGGSARLGMGHLRNVPSLARTLTSAESDEVRPVDRLVWEHLSMSARQLAAETVRTGQVSDADKQVLLNALNEVIASREFYASFDRQQLSEEATAVLVERDRLIAEDKALELKRAGLVSLRDQLQTEQTPELNELDAKRTPLLIRRRELAEGVQEPTAKRDDLKVLLTSELEKEGPSTQIPALRLQLADLDNDIRGLNREISDLDDRLVPLEKRLSELNRPVNRFENEIHRLEGLLSSIRRRVGAQDQTGTLEEKVNRILMVSFYPDSISSMPRGQSVLLTGGDADPYVVDTLNQGWDGPQPLSLTKLPWQQWWPTLRIWVTVAVLMAIAVLCVVVIVHPQWSRRELLAYPIARFVEEATHVEGEGKVPIVLQSRLFWYGFGALIFLHLVNGLHKWFPDQMFLQIPVTLDFSALGELMPNAMRIPATPNLTPTIYLSVLAFAYFLNSDVSFSLGMAPFAWGMLGAFCYSHGIAAEHNATSGKELNLLLFGACLGMTVMVLYVGRRYYLNVLASALGFGPRSDTPGYAKWAARVLAVCLAGAVVVLWWSGLNLSFSILALLLVLMLGFVAARVNAESGLFFLHPGWAVSGVLLAFLGTDAISPQALVVLGLISVLFTMDARETWMPFLVNGLRMATGGRSESASARAPVRHVAPLMGLMIVLGFGVALSATFYLQYNRGFNHLDASSTQRQPTYTFNALSGHVSKLSAHGRLVEATNYGESEWVKAVTPDRKLMVWTGLGFGLVVLCSIARLKLSWWFIHPVMFIFWGGWARKVFAASFLLGFLVKIAVVKLGGAKSYSNAKPLMIGIIAGELVAGLGWMLVGAIYWALAGQAPTPYYITPN